jgi:hypothetical protein
MQASCIDIFEILDRTKPDTENITGLNFGSDQAYERLSD